MSKESRPGSNDLEKQSYPGSMVAFFCNGNQLRSLYAAECFRKKMQLQKPPFPEVVDAGVIADPKKNPHPPTVVLDEMKSRGIDASGHITTHVSQVVITSETDVIAFCSPTLIPQPIIDSAKSVVYFNIPDPSFYHLSQFSTYIKYACDNIERLVMEDLTPLMYDLRNGNLEETKHNGIYIPSWQPTPFPIEPVWEWDKYIDENRFYR